MFLVWGGLDALKVSPLSHHLALRMRLVSSKAQSMIGHRASVQSEVAGAVPLFRLNRKRLMLAKVPWPAVVCPRSEDGQYPCLCFSLAGGAQFVLFCSVDPFVSHFFCLLISCLLSSWPVCAASCVLLWFVRFHVVRDSSLRRRYLTCRTSGSRLLWQYCQTAVNLVFGWIMGPTREARLIAYPPRGCSLRMRREQPVLDRHRPVSNL